MLRMPQCVIEYPFELLISVWGLVSGVALLTGVATPTSLTELMSPWTRIAWAAALTVGAGTVAVGLARHRYGTSVARGLILLAAACLSYSVGLAALGVADTIPALPLVVAVGLLCLVRGWWLRTRDAILRHVVKEAA